MAIVNWKSGLYSMQFWGKVGTSWGMGEMILGDSYLGVFSPFFGVYQRRKGRKSKILVKCRYQVPPDPKTPAQLASRYYMGDINKIFKELTETELQKLRNESIRVGLNNFQVHARFMQLERPSQLGAMHLGFSNLGELRVFQ